MGAVAFYSELEGLTLNELIERWNGPPIEPETPTVYYQEVASLLSKQGEAAVQFMVDFLLNPDNPDNPDEIERLAAILIFQPETQESKLKQQLLRYLGDSRPHLAGFAVRGFQLRGDETVKEQVLAHRNHPDPYVRGAVLDYLSHLFPDEAPPILLQALKDTDYIVRESAIDGLDDLQYVEAIPDITLVLNDEHQHVRQAAETALKNFSNFNSKI
jgi:HEAT repeats